MFGSPSTSYVENSTDSGYRWRRKVGPHIPSTEHTAVDSDALGVPTLLGVSDESIALGCVRSDR